MNTEHELCPYQITGAGFLARRDRAYIFDEPGLGKSAQAIRARENAGAGRTLVVCPAGVRQVWPYEFRRWGRTNARVARADTVFDLVAWQKGKIDVLVCSFEQAVQWRHELTADFFDLLIVDEMHYLKNPQAKRTLAIVGPTGTGGGGVAGMADRTWGLTGTPIKNDPADLWVPLRLARATALGFPAFQKRYFSQRAGTFSVTNTVRKPMLAELQSLLASVSVMRTFAEVGQELPPVRLDVLPVDGEHTEALNYLRQYPGLSERILQIIEGGGSLVFDDNAHVATLRALIAEAKAPGYARLITEELRSGVTDKLVVIAYHKRAIQLIADHLNAAGINAQRLVGDTPERQRETIVRSFQDDPAGVRVIVANIQVAGLGLTLTRAARLDMLESSWTPADNVQAVRRIRRRGQTRPTFVRFVTLLGSFDEVVSAIVVRKASTTLLITEKNNMQEAMAR